MLCALKLFVLVAFVDCTPAGLNSGNSWSIQQWIIFRNTLSQGYEISTINFNVFAQRIRHATIRKEVSKVDTPILVKHIQLWDVMNNSIIKPYFGRRHVDHLSHFRFWETVHMYFKLAHIYSRSSYGSVVVQAPCEPQEELALLPFASKLVTRLTNHKKGHRSCSFQTQKQKY